MHKFSAQSSFHQEGRVFSAACQQCLRPEVLLDHPLKQIPTTASESLRMQAQSIHKTTEQAVVFSWVVGGEGDQLQNRYSVSDILGGNPDPLNVTGISSLTLFFFTFFLYSFLSLLFFSPCFQVWFGHIKVKIQQLSQNIYSCSQK